MKGKALAHIHLRKLTYFTIMKLNMIIKPSTKIMTLKTEIKILINFIMENMTSSIITKRTVDQRVCKDRGVMRFTGYLLESTNSIHYTSEMKINLSILVENKSRYLLKVALMKDGTAKVASLTLIRILKIKLAYLTTVMRAR